MAPLPILPGLDLFGCGLSALSRSARLVDHFGNAIFWEHVMAFKTAMLTVLLCAMFPIAACAENWPGWEGLFHQSSSAIDISCVPETYEVKWDKRFVPTWQIESSPGHFHSRNIAYYYGYIALCATTYNTYTYGSDRAHVVILNAEDGSIATCISTRQWYGSQHGMADAVETPRGQQVMAWDPDTGILHMAAGGDGPSHRSYLPLANAHLFNAQTGVPVAGVGAWNDFCMKYPGFEGARGRIRITEDSISAGYPPLFPDEWDAQTRAAGHWAANRSCFFDIQPGSPYMVISNDSSHNPTSGSSITNKYTGRSAHDADDQYDYSSETGCYIWSRLGSQIVKGDVIYFMGPYDPTWSQGQPIWPCYTHGMHLTAIRYVNQDIHPNSGYEGPGAAETAHRSQVVFDYKLESDNTDGEGISWREGDRNSQNLAWFAQDDGVWAAWKPNQIRNVELIHATAASVSRFDLGVGADMKTWDINPEIAYADLGGQGRYVVYYIAPGSDAVNKHWSLTVFDAETGSVKWTYQLKNGTTGDFPGIPASSQYCYVYYSRMVVAGKYALVSWMDTTGTNVKLRVLPIDITLASAPSSPPQTFDYELANPTVPSASYRASRIMDMAVVNGMLYVLLTEDNVQVATGGGCDGLIVAQRVVAIGLVSRTEMVVDFTATPESGLGQVNAAFNASACTTTAGGGITSYEWDYDYDHLDFTADAQGSTAAHLFNTQGTHTVGLRVTDSTGHSELRSKTVAVTPDEQPVQSLTFNPITQIAIRCDGNTANKRVSGTFNVDYGTGTEHSRGYVDFENVSLDSSYTLVEARLHFNISRFSGRGSVATVHRLGPADVAPATWAGISSITGVDEDGDNLSPIAPLSTAIVNLNYTGPVFFNVTRAVQDWLATPSSQRGFLLTVDSCLSNYDDYAPGKLVAGTSFFTGEKRDSQWDWDSTSLEILYRSQSTDLDIITTSPLPCASEDTAYSVPLQAVNVTGTAVWSLTVGTLPSGLSLSSAGVLTGTPDTGTAGSYVFTVQVADDKPDTDSKEFSLTVNGPGSINATITGDPTVETGTYTIRDTFIRITNQASSFKDWDFLRPEANTGQDNHALVIINLSAYPVGQSCDSAILRYRQQSGDHPKLVLHPMTTAWNWTNTCWDLAGPSVWSAGDFSASDYTSGVTVDGTLSGEWWEFNITSLVNQWIAGSLPNTGVVIMCDKGAQSYGSVTLDSVNCTTVANRPQLIMTSTGPGYSISGAITGLLFLADDVTIGYTGGKTGSVSTTDSGTYTIRDLDDGDAITITPIPNTGYTFMPVSDTRTITGANITGVNFAATAQDLEQDGLPDPWEIHYFGNTTLYSGTDDPDGDSADNAAEYIAGTNPITAPSPGNFAWSATSYSVNEFAGTATITVQRTGGSSGAVSVNYATSNGSATAGSDYTAVNQVLTWPDGDATNRTFTVTILNDAIVESVETVTLTLSNPTGGAGITQPNPVTLTINDDDTAATGHSASHGGGCLPSAGCGLLPMAMGVLMLLDRHRNRA